MASSLWGLFLAFLSFSCSVTILSIIANIFAAPAVTVLSLIFDLFLTLTMVSPLSLTFGDCEPVDYSCSYSSFSLIVDFVSALYNLSQHSALSF